MLKIPKPGKLHDSVDLLFIVAFQIVALFFSGHAHALGQDLGSLPNESHISSNMPTNPATTGDPQSIRTTDVVSNEDLGMVDVTITVESKEDLYAALANATGGETILLAPGNYGELSIWSGSGFNISPTSPITIASLDPNNTASFSELHLNGVSNYTFSNLLFDYSFSSSDANWFRPFEINNSSSIQILDSTFDGDVAAGISESADGFGYAFGLSVRSSENIEISGNEFTTWLRAAIFSDTDNLVVSQNEIHSIRSDGLDFVQVTNVLIEGNYIHDFATSPTSGDHVDYIQFWTNGTTEPSTDILIRGNILDMGEGGASQSIFLRNEEVDTGRAGIEMYYQNVVIEQNLILGGHLHGITVGEVDGLLIQGNTILAAPNPEATVNIPTVNVDSDSLNVSILQNAVAKINGYVDQASWNISGNAFIQNTDASAPGYYGDVFVESSMFGSNGVVDYVVAPGSMLELLQAGYSGLFSVSSAQSVRALFDVSTSQDDMSNLILDGRYSFGSGGGSLPDGTTFLWTLDTGETFSGPVLLHRFEAAGQHEVELMVTAPDGSVSIAFANVSIAGPDLLGFDQTSGAFLAYGYGETKTVFQSDVGSTELSSGAFAIDLGGSGTQVSVSRHSIERIFGAESMSLSFAIQADAAGSYGEVFRIHSSFVASITATGELQFQFFSDSGENLILKTTGAGLNDGEVHEISIVLDDLGDSLSITVDGAVLSKTSVFGTVPNMGSWDLAFGNPWGSQNFDGKILSFDLDVSNNDYQFFSGDADGYFAEALVVDSEPTSTAELEAATPTAPLPEMTGYKLDFTGLANGTEGKMTGDAYVGVSSGVIGLVLDGTNDAARIGTLHDYDTSSVLALDVSFARTNLDPNSQALVSNSSRVTVSLAGDSIEVSIGGASSKASSASFSVEDLGIADLSTHSLRIVADDQSDHIQMFVDGSLVFDRSDLQFSFDTASTAKNWWSKGWTIGEGGRHDGDFEGIVTDFAVDDTALFI